MGGWVCMSCLCMWVCEGGACEVNGCVGVHVRYEWVCGCACHV